MLSHIQRCTKEAQRVLQTDNWRVPLHELDAFLAIVYARGAHKATKIKVHEFRNRLWAIPIISKTMACNRFIKIMKFLRFDYKQTRSHRLATDKLALIETVWYTFVGNCLRHYRRGANITVDEQLFPTKARCRFTQNMPNTEWDYLAPPFGRCLLGAFLVLFKISFYNKSFKTSFWYFFIMNLFKF